jgi:hypothetical protein
MMQRHPLLKDQCRRHAQGWKSGTRTRTKVWNTATFSTYGNNTSRCRPSSSSLSLSLGCGCARWRWLEAPVPLPSCMAAHSPTPAAAGILRVTWLGRRGPRGWRHKPTAFTPRPASLAVRLDAAPWQWLHVTPATGACSTPGGLRPLRSLRPMTHGLTLAMAGCSLSARGW